AILACPALTTSATQPAEQKTFSSGRTVRTYYESAPQSIGSGPGAPLLILLHGSGLNGRAMIDSWIALSRERGFIAVAPDALDSRAWRLQDDGPAVFRDLLQRVMSEHRVDGRRIYLFGHSGGAVYVLTLGLLESELFAAIAVHAGGWRRTQEYRVLQYASRKIPVAVFVGDRDRYFPVRDVRRTHAALQEEGHTAMITILPRHNHDYSRVATEVNVAAWEFLHGYELPSIPRFHDYESK
ncbi:MAG: alpha/beta hydrolase family esterase, partial [Steroidobacter sp.]